MAQYEIDRITIKKTEMYYGNPTAPKLVWQISDEGKKKYYDMDGSLSLIDVLNTFAGDGWSIASYSEDEEKESYSLILQREKTADPTEASK